MNLGEVPVESWIRLVDGPQSLRAAVFQVVHDGLNRLLVMETGVMMHVPDSVRVEVVKPTERPKAAARKLMAERARSLTVLQWRHVHPGTWIVISDGEGRHAVERVGLVSWESGRKVLQVADRGGILITMGFGSQKPVRLASKHELPIPAVVEVLQGAHRRAMQRERGA